uniref:acid phosphatase n=1 Tax=Cyanistes caeruleus TaxID=156563 RepID=A0A8C0ULS5_CYACU
MSENFTAVSHRTLILSLGFFFLNSNLQFHLFYQVFRHGDHTPQEFFPTDKHREIARQQGYGQLTKLGIQQQYELGQYMRRRYSHFLSVVYKQCEIYVQSTDCDHTLMSAQASLAGLYPPTQKKILQFSFQLLYLPFSHCPKHKELLRETFATRDFQRQFKKPPCFLSSLQDTNNYTLPVWATHGVRTKLMKLSELLLQAEFGIHKQRQKSRLQGGNRESIKRCAGDIVKLIKGFLCSQHAATIAALQMALNVFNGKLPPHSACHFLELYQEKNGQYTIEMYYRNNTLREPHPLTLPGCKFRCPLERFTHLVSPILVHYWTRESTIGNTVHQESCS